MGKGALVDYNKCLPGKCEDGICVAVDVCSHNLIKQEAPYETPIPSPSACQCCGDCVRACKQKAIQIMKM